MRPQDIVTVAFLAPAVVILVWFAIADMRLRRWAKRENARLHAEWVADMARAKANGTLPPFPPNRIVVR